MKIFYPKGLADICAIPKSLIGRTLALGALAGISGGAVLGAWHILWRAIGVMAYGSGLVFESRGAAAAHALRQRASRYNAGVFRAQRLEIEGKALVVFHDDTCGVDTLTRDRAALESLYEKGFNDGAKVVEFMAGA